jgi:PAB-dependent poly(A)-specific ribonuclease subunit 2
MKMNRYLCCADVTGKIQLKDPKTLRTEHSLETHNATISDMDSSGNYVVSCGFSSR